MKPTGAQTRTGLQKGLQTYLQTYYYAITVTPISSKVDYNAKLCNGEQLKNYKLCPPNLLPVLTGGCVKGTIPPFAQRLMPKHVAANTITVVDDTLAGEEVRRRRRSTHEHTNTHIHIHKHSHASLHFTALGGDGEEGLDLPVRSP